MDMRTGRIYLSEEHARDAGVPESDIAQFDPKDPIGTVRLVRFRKNPFATIRNPKKKETAK